MPGWKGVRKDPAYNTAEWRRAREACLKRANRRCEVRLAGCTGAAAEADHVDGLASDPQHKRLRAVCRPCHDKITSRQAHVARNGGGHADPLPQPRTNWTP